MIVLVSRLASYANDHALARVIRALGSHGYTAVIEQDVILLRFDDVDKADGPRADAVLDTLKLDVKGFVVDDVHEEDDFWNAGNVLGDFPEVGSADDEVPY